MTDLAKSVADSDAFAQELGEWFVPIKYFEDSQRRFDPERKQRFQFVEKDFVPTGILSSFRVKEDGTSKIKLGENTDKNGNLYVRITDGAPNTISIYKATGGGGGDLVCQGTGNDSTNDVELAEQNNSGLVLLVNIGVIGANETDDVRRLQCLPDFPTRTHIWESTQKHHPFLKGRYLDACVIGRDSAIAARDEFLAGLRDFLSTRWADFWSAASVNATTPILQEPDIDNGQVDVRTAGLLELGRKNMKDNTAEITVEQNTPTAGAAAFDSDNQGIGALAVPTVKEWAPPAVVSFICADRTVGSEKFDVSAIRTDTGEIIQALTQLQVKKTWSDPVIGLEDVLLTRTLELEAGVAADFTIAGFSIDGETPSNTESGKIYLQIEENPTPGTFRIVGYRASTLLAADEVLRTAYGAANASVLITSSSSFSGTLQLGSAPTDLNTGTLDLQTFQVENTAAGVADRINVTITVASRGAFQAVLADFFQFALNSAAAGAETWDEGYAVAGGIPPHSVEDVF